MKTNTSIDPNVEVEIHASYYNNDDVPSHFGCAAFFATKEDAKAYAAQYPKALQMKAATLGGRPEVTAMVTMDAWLAGNRVTGERNEAGIKRINRFLDLCPNTKWVTPFSNSYRTREDFLRRIA